MERCRVQILPARIHQRPARVGTLQRLQSAVSAEAVRAVLQRSPARGPHLLALIVIADASADRGNYPRSQIGMDAIACRSRTSPRRCKAIIAELLQRGQLQLIHQGGGNAANTYEIPVLKADRVPVLKSAPVIREEPLERESRAENVIPLPVTYSKKRQG
jgi:hypothetical protein